MSLLITFIVLYVIIYMFHPSDDKAWLRALLITITFIIGGLIIQKFEMMGWVIAAILEMIVVMKVMRYSFSAALFFLVVLAILQQIIDLGVEKYIK